jgi:hypothetical protein
MGMELRGMPFRALFELEERAKAMAEAEIAIATPAVSILALSRNERTGPSAEAMMAILPLTDPSGGLTRALAIYSEKPSVTPYVNDIRGRFVISRSWSIDIPEAGRVMAAFGPRPMPATAARAVAGGRMVAAAQDGDASADVRPMFRVIEGGRA